MRPKAFRNGMNRAVLLTALGVAGVCAVKPPDEPDTVDKVPCHTPTVAPIVIVKSTLISAGNY